MNEVVKRKHPQFTERHDKLVFQHTNFHLHEAKLVKETLEGLPWDILTHLLYSIELASSDYNFFRSMNSANLRKQIRYFEEIEN